MTEPILMIGTGALACLFAGRLSRSGFPVVMTGSWKTGLEALRKQGVMLIEGKEKSVFPVEVLDITETSRFFPRALLLTKAYQTFEALKRVQPFLPEDGTVLSLQNGLTARSLMVEVIGESRAISGITTCAAELVEPGIVNFHGGSSIFLGSHPAAAWYRDVFQAAGFSVSTTSDIQKMIWEKAIINSAANPVGALLRMKNGEMSCSQEVGYLLDDLINEACQVANLEGCDINPAEISIRLQTILRESSANRCSMLQDVLHGRDTEIEEINGAIVSLAKKHGIDVPVQRTITRLVRSIKSEVD